MAETRIRRKSSVATATVGTATTDATIVDFRGMAGGIVSFDSAIPTAATTLTFWASDTTTGPFYQAFDKDGSALAITLSTNTGVAYALPFDVGGCEFVRVVCNASLGTASAARVAMKG